MPPPNEKLAVSLKALGELQKKGFSVIKSDELSRIDRERLMEAGFLSPILRGWYLSTRPGEQDGDSTAWFSGVRSFISRYCADRFGADWCLSSEASLLIHAGNTTIPRQIIIHAPGGSNNDIKLPHGISLFEYRAKDMAPADAITSYNGLQILKVAPTLVRISESFIQANPVDVQIAMRQISDASDLLHILLEGDHSIIAGRLAGAFRATGNIVVADQIVSAMRAAYHTVRETNPFETPPVILSSTRQISPYVDRLHLMWQVMRGPVIAIMGDDPGTPPDIEKCLSDIEDRYVSDAYHSLSIEGYQVTEDLINRVRSGDWNPEQSSEDKQSRDAMAARGYWEAHNKVKESIRAILGGQNAGKALRSDLSKWYLALFSPSVQIGLLKPADLAGYRNDQVFIKNSMHTPLSKEAVRDCMPALFDLIENEPIASVRAVLGHFLFVFVHPYMDGNGRTGRFIMNTMLTTGGYPWTIIEKERRDDYMKALEAASVQQDIQPFVRFIAECVKEQEKEIPRRRAGPR